MGNFNKIMLLGNCTRDVEVKFSPGGVAFAQWGLATNRNYTNSAGEKVEETCFVDIKAFGRTAEIAGEYLQKGSPVFIEGRLSYYRWDDEQGNPHSKHSVVVESLQLLPRSEQRGVAPPPPPSAEEDGYRNTGHKEVPDDVPF